MDLADVQVDQKARRALEVAAAGGHHLLLVSPPGTPTTALIRRLPGILPPLTPEEAMVSTAAHSVAGLLGPDASLLPERPFRAPHFSASLAALIGGGDRDARPGEVSLAHNGVLLLDRISEFDRHTLDALGEARKERVARISRAGRTIELPARFQMVGTMPPCVCGETVGGCRCSQSEVDRHHDSVPQAVRDRFDMTVRVERTPGSVPAGRVPAEDSGAVRARVCRARDRQAERWDSGSGTTNAELEGAELRRQCRLDTASLPLVERVTQRLGLADDGFDRVLRVARTIADLDDAADIRQVHAAEACQYVGAAHRLLQGGDGRHAS